MTYLVRILALMAPRCFVNRTVRRSRGSAQGLPTAATYRGQGVAVPAS